MTTYTWTTPKGAKIEIEVSVEHITRKTVSADGIPVEVACNTWLREVKSCKLNGKETKMKKLCSDRIIIDRRGQQNVAAALPEDVIEAIYGEERRATSERIDRELAIAAKREAERKAIYNAMR